MDKVNEVQINTYLKAEGICSMAEHVLQKIVVQQKMTGKKRVSKRPRDNEHMAGLLQEYTEAEIGENMFTHSPLF